MRLVVLVDGEHYPPVVRAAIGRLRARGDDVVAAVFCGGTEKVSPGDLESAYGIALLAGGSVGDLLGAALDDAARAGTPVDAVLDLSDEPVLRPADRLRLATVALVRDVEYRGPDFTFRPPPLARVLTKPAIRVIATGKRTGKTALCGALARRAVSRGFRPAVVAMGRGGPDDPQVVEAGTRLGPAELLDLADAGMHAASDYLEDAVTSRVTTIGCRRVGGGLAGAPFESNVVQGALIAQSRDEDLVLLEGSGAAVPPVAAHAGCVCVPAGCGRNDLDDHLVGYRLLLADLAVVTMAEDENLAALTEGVLRELTPQIDIVRAVFRPRPLTDVRGRTVFFCSTARPQAAPVLVRHLQEVHGCEVVGMTHALADRQSLQRDLDHAAPFDVLVTEVKGAAIDVAVRHALRAGREAVLADNEVLGDGIDGAFDRLLDSAVSRSTNA